MSSLPLKNIWGVNKTLYSKKSIQQAHDGMQFRIWGDHFEILEKSLKF